jgi:hypothetical protein
MNIVIAPTGQFESVNGLRCRIWRGHTESGMEIHAYVAVVRTPANKCPELEQALKEVQGVRELVSFDLRLLL